MNCKVILILLFALGSKAAFAGNTISLTVAFDASVSWRIYKVTTLSANDKVFEPRQELDSITHRYTLIWDSLKKGNYKFTVITVFGDTQVYAYNLRRDTSIVIAQKYQMLGSQSLEANYRNSDRISIFYRTSGCFHENTEHFTIERISPRKYLCTLTKDSAAIVDSIARDGVKRKWRIIIPVSDVRYTDAGVIDSVCKLVSDSKSQQDKVDQMHIRCASTTHQSLFVLSGNLLFQFSDFGICDWTLYDDFVKRYFTNREEQPRKGACPIML